MFARLSLPARRLLPVVLLVVTAASLARAEFTGTDGPLPPAEPKDKGAGPAKAEPNERTFEFTYVATVTGLKPEQAARVWLPVPSDSDEQKVEILTPLGGAKLTTEKFYGNRMYYLEAKADAEGKVPLGMRFKVTRKEVRGANKEVAEDMAKIARYLQADAMVPVEGKPLELLKGKTLPKDQTEAARVMYDVVNQHMRYSKAGTGWGRGDSVWACESGYGNCTDFHSLFISLARAQKIPAKFEIGFPLPEKRGAGDVAGYHCWAKFKPEGKGWVAVDISEANKNPELADYYFGNLTADRVAFSTGRDLTLEPKQDGGPLNFFIYPYVEVEGKAYPQEKIVRKFSFKDVEK
jgi:transglutaminase-like putative cysteine protease